LILMKKGTGRILIPICLFFSLVLTSCSWWQKPLDRTSGFSALLRKTATAIQAADWASALASWEQTQAAWRRIKPYLQIGIDHDYINGLEDHLTLLKGHLIAGEQGDALVLILLIENTWETMGDL